MALMVNNLTGFGGGSESPLLYDIIQEFGLGTNLAACWDVADLQCYSGTGDDWTDRVDPTNNIWVRGNGTAANKPTFNGTAGLATESTYWSFDGTDFFQESGLMTFANDWHHNNKKFSMVWGIYARGTAGTQVLFTPDNFGSTYTFYTGLNSSEESLLVFAEDGVAHPSATSLTLNSWNISSMSFDESALSVDYNINGSASSDATNANTSTSSPADQYCLMASQVGANEVASGTRLAFVAMWSTNIGATAMQNLYTILKARRLPSAP